MMKKSLKVLIFVVFLIVPHKVDAKHHKQTTRRTTAAAAATTQAPPPYQQNPPAYEHPPPSSFNQPQPNQPGFHPQQPQGGYNQPPPQGGFAPSGYHPQPVAQQPSSGGGLGVGSGLAIGKSLNFANLEQFKRKFEL